MRRGGLSEHLEPLEWMSIGARANSLHDACDMLTPVLETIGAASAGVVFEMHMALGTFPSEEEMWGHFVNDAWHAYYAQNQHLIRHDIMARHLFTSPVPHYVDIRRRETFPFDPITAEEAEFIEKVIDFGLYQSLAMAMPDPKTRKVSHFMLNRGRDETGDLDELGQNHLAELRLAVRFFFEGLLIGELADDDLDTVLSPRERDCLQWAAVGKTTKEIANLMHIADDTVNDYFASARVKLRASNRTQAVVRAIAIGLIAP